jgi:hypothetical protein
MNKKKIVAGIATGVLIVAALLSATSCKKQPKCGCNGDPLDTLNLTHVYITYDADNKTAQFSPIWNSYEIYYFCNPSEWMSTLTKFKQCEEILISGTYFYECNYLMNSSNSYYYNLWRIYQINVTDVRAYEYGK